MKNVLKIVFLGVIGFALLVYLTAPSQEELKKVNGLVNAKKINLSSFPLHLDIVGSKKYIKKDEFFKVGNKKYIIVLNHDSLALVEGLKIKLNTNVVLVANVSQTPWFIKELAVNGKLEELTKNSNISMINDSDGKVIKALNIRDNTQTRYFIYEIKEDGVISKVAQNDVKRDALKIGLSKDELDASISSILNDIK